MRPYLAIIKDSFREALASRVLWILLILITLLLLPMTPLGYREEATTGLKENAIRELPEFIDRLRTEGRRPEPSPARRMWTLLDDDAQRKVADFAMPEEGDAAGAFEFIRTVKDIVPALDQAAKTPDFYDPESFEKTRLTSQEARDLKKRLDELSAEERLRFNRLLIEAAFPELIRPSPPTSLAVTYAAWDVMGPMPVTARRFQQILDSWMSTIMEWVVGTLGIFAAVLVTASIIPNTFEPGSINLLLSKPVSRWLLFLAKFFGGCAFILINAVYLIGGLLLILGFRFGIWEASLLWAVPVYMFVFAIYYSVSALVGLIWRNTVVSIAVTILFWLTCFGVGAAKSLMESAWLSKTRIVRLVTAADTVIAVNELGLPSRWDDQQGQWSDTFLSEDQRQMRPMMTFMPLEALPGPIGPVYDARRQRLVAVLRSLRTRELAVHVGKQAEDWENLTGVQAPTGTFAMFREPDGDLLLVSSIGLYRLVGDPLASPKPVSFLGVDVPFTGSSPFRSVGPEPAVILTSPAAAAMNADTGSLAVYSRGQLSLLAPNDREQYEVRRQRQLDGKDGQAATLAFGGDTLLVARQDGSILMLDGQTLDQRATFAPEGSGPPRFVAAASGGRWFSIVFHNGDLFLLDAQAGALTAADVRGQGDISTATFTPQGTLLVADRGTRVIEYDVITAQEVRRYAPGAGVLERVYRWIVVPVYTVFPKPGELDKTIDYLLSGEETRATGREAGDLESARERLDPWSPVWSSLAFTIVVLALACVYIERQEF
jgi:ABC-type transport system involved in multi-copper enzyme maturation permease subunit